MRIIGLIGHGNCGKSETLNDLKELLRAAGKSISSSEHPNCDKPESFKYHGLIICVAPGGDTQSIVEDNCRYFKLKKCDVAISATRKKGGPVVALEKYALSEGVDVEWFQKSYEYSLSRDTQKLCNQETAELLLKIICIR